MTPASTPSRCHDSTPARKHNSMLVIAIASQKGGVGKTTLAVHLADTAHAGGYETLVIDLDLQDTARTWSEWRKRRDPYVIGVLPNMLERTLADAKADGAQVVIIDTPPSASEAAREAVKAADIVLIPVRPRAFDLHAITTTAALVQGHGEAWAVLNAIPPRAPRRVAEAVNEITAKGLPVCPYMVTERAALHRAVTDGRTAREAEPQGKAAAEIAALWGWLLERTTMSARHHDSTSARQHVSAKGRAR